MTIETGGHIAETGIIETGDLEAKTGGISAEKEE